MIQLLRETLIKDKNIFEENFYEAFQLDNEQE